MKRFAPSLSLRSLVAASLFLGFACTGEEDDGAEQDVALCKVPGSYGALGAVTASATVNGNGDPLIAITLDGNQPRDILQLRLVAGAGAFTGGIKAGTFPIAGADAAFTGCGLCVAIIADIVAGVGPTKFYQATSGSVTLTSAARPYAGTVDDLSFVEVAVDGTPQPGCKAEIASMSFTSN